MRGPCVEAWIGHGLWVAVLLFMSITDSSVARLEGLCIQYLRFTQDNECIKQPPRFCCTKGGFEVFCAERRFIKLRLGQGHKDRDFSLLPPTWRLDL